MPESVIEREEDGCVGKADVPFGCAEALRFCRCSFGAFQIAKVPLFRKWTDAETDVLCGQARNSAEFHCICGRFMVE